MVELTLAERTTRLLRRLEVMAIDLVKEKGTALSALAPHLDVGINTPGNHLMRNRPEGEHTDPRWAFAIFEHFGKDPIPLLASLCSSGPPEEMLALVPIPEKAAGRPRKTKARKKRLDCLRAARRLESMIPSEPAAVMAKPWPVRRFHDADLGPVYEELEDLEERRHLDAEGVESVCHQAITCDLPDDPALEQLVRRVGLLGIWGAVQRSKQRLEFARDALSLSAACARKLGDQSLLADQLQRSAYVFQDLDAGAAAIAVAREASELSRMDENRDADAYAMITRGSIAALQGHMELADPLLRVGLRCLSPSGSPVFRSMALQNVAICRDHRGDVEGALAFLSAAAAEHEGLGARFKAGLLLTAGNLQRKMRRFSDAEENYWEALNLLEEVADPGAKFTVCLELTVCLARSGETHRREEVAAKLRKLLSEIPSQRFLQTQVELLLRELASEAVDLEVLRKLREGQAEETRRS